MVRLTAQETIAIEKRYVGIIIHTKRRRHAMPWVPHGKTPGSAEKQREHKESTGKILDCGFHRKEQARQGEQV